MPLSSLRAGLDIHLAAAGRAYPHGRHPALAAWEMTTTMAVGMAAWMTLSQAQLGEHPGDVRCSVRAGIVLVRLLWLDAVPARSLSTLLHMVMLPLMLVVMLWRRSQDTS